VKRAGLAVLALALAVCIAGTVQPPDVLALGALLLAYLLGRASVRVDEFLAALEDDSRVSEATRQRLDDGRIL
jgi:hypothetical protein